jgi:hypothetical protein
MGSPASSVLRTGEPVITVARHHEQRKIQRTKIE